MKSLCVWIQVGLLSAIAFWGSLCRAEDGLPLEKEDSRPTSVTPDVEQEEPKADDVQPSFESKLTASLQPEPETALPQSSATPPTGDSSDTKKPQPAVDLDAQFEIPIEVNPQPANRSATELRGLFSNPPTTTSKPLTQKPDSLDSQQIFEPAPQPPIIAEPVDPLLKLVNEAIEVSSRRYLTPDGQRPHTPWQILHGMLAYRQDYVLKMADGRKVNGLEWISSGVSYQGESLFQKTPYGGRAHPFIQAYWFEGHPTQFMAYLTMCRLPLKHEFKTATGEIVTVGDIINNAKMEVVRPAVNQPIESTWTLWALAHYLEPDAQWTNKKGEPWSIEELVRLEVKNTVYDGPCGGTHSLFATAYARNSHLQSRRPLRGVWLEADQKVQRFIAEARSLQNGDGSFSIHFFKGPGASNDFNTRITSSGHMVEWLMVALPQSRLSEPWIQNGVRRLAQDLIDHRNTNAECGPLYHAVDGLQIYRERMRLASKVAQKPNGWKATRTGSWPQAKALVGGGQIQESNAPTTEVNPQTAAAPLPLIQSKPGAETVVPRRIRPAQTVEQPSKTSRQ